MRVDTINSKMTFLFIWISLKLELNSLNFFILESTKKHGIYSNFGGAKII